MTDTLIDLDDPAAREDVRERDLAIDTSNVDLALSGDFRLEVLVEAEKLTATEVAIRAELLNGLSLTEALRKYGHV